MSGYIYTVKEQDNAQLDYPGQIRIQSTKKYEAKAFLKKQLDEGMSLSQFEVSRSRDGKVDSTHYYDVYEFMQIDLGEIE